MIKCNNLSLLTLQQNNFLQVSLIKKNADLIWPYFIPGGPAESNDNGDNEPLGSSAPVSNLTTQIEECDLGVNGQIANEFFIGNY